jgi:hypothetical protein
MSLACSPVRPHARLLLIAGPGSFISAHSILECLLLREAESHQPCRSLRLARNTTRRHAAHTRSLPKRAIPANLLSGIGSLPGNPGSNQYPFDPTADDYSYKTERPHQALDMATPADRFRLEPLAKDGGSVPVDEAENHPGQWVLRRVASNGVVSVDNQMFSVRNAYKAQLVDVFVDDTVIQVWSKNHLIKTVARARTRRSERSGPTPSTSASADNEASSISWHLTGGVSCSGDAGRSGVT